MTTDGAGPFAAPLTLDTFLSLEEGDASGAWLLSVPAQTVLPRAPAVTHETMAKIALGTMLGLAALTVLSLLWMALRMRRRGSFGRKAGAVLRSLYAVVLGIGGLLLGMLIVLTALPTVPLADELFVAVSVGVPVGLGTFFAWVNRDWTAKSKAMGVAAALAGALVGARLGFDAADVPLALLTAIGGAVVGGNLTLIALDIVWDRQARDRFAGDHATEPLEARPSIGRRAPSRLVTSCGPAGRDVFGDHELRRSRRQRTSATSAPGS